MKAHILLTSLLVLGNASAAHAGQKEKEPPEANGGKQAAATPFRKLAAYLQEPMDMSDFMKAMTLKEFLGRLHERARAQGKELPFIVDTAAFQLEDPDAEDIHDTAIQFEKLAQQLPPFCVLDYISETNIRKDYEDSFDKYERDLKVPYYLTFYPDNQELTLYRHTGKKYVSVKPNQHGRYPIRELDLEVALLDGWVRFWREGELLGLPEEMPRDLDEAKRRADGEKIRADDLQRRLEQAERALGQLRTGGAQPSARRNNSARKEK